MQATLKTLIFEHRLERLTEVFLAAATIGIRLFREPSRDYSLGTSRFGGAPDVPPGFIWPTKDGRPLGFLAQINCAEIAQHDSERALPESGVLYFFYDMQEQPWGFDPKDRGGAVVLFTPGHTLTEAVLPFSSLPAIPVGFRPFLSIPSALSTDAYRALGVRDDERDAYWDLCRSIRSAAGAKQPNHQILGHPDIVQNDMQLECQLVSNGIYCGDANGYNDPKADQLKSGAADWRLLLQFDSDDDLNVMWGDTGIVYFWIREPDLRQRDFSNTWTILQCC